MLFLCVYDTVWRMCSTQWKVSDLPKLEDHVCAGPVEGVRFPETGLQADVDARN